MEMMCICRFVLGNVLKMGKMMRNPKKKKKVFLEKHKF